MNRRRFLRALGVGAVIAPTVPIAEIGSALTAPGILPIPRRYPYASAETDMAYMYGRITLKASDFNADSTQRVINNIMSSPEFAARWTSPDAP